MYESRRRGSLSLWLACLGVTVLVMAACVRTPGPAPIPSQTTNSGSNIVLDGRHELPRVGTAATGAGTISGLMDKSVSGNIVTSGIDGTAAHIHMAPAGQNGPVIAPLNKTAENVWSVPPGIRLTDSEYEAFKQGNLYVNVHSATNPNGEIRGQLAQ